MTDVSEPLNRDASETLEVHAGVGKARLDVQLRMTPRGLVAVGGLVSGILLSTAVLVYAATSVARQHPVARARGRR